MALAVSDPRGCELPIVPIRDRSPFAAIRKLKPPLIAPEISATLGAPLPTGTMETTAIGDPEKPAVVSSK